MCLQNLDFRLILEAPYYFWGGIMVITINCCFPHLFQNLRPPCPVHPPCYRFQPPRPRPPPQLPRPLSRLPLGPPRRYPSPGSAPSRPVGFIFERDFLGHDMKIGKIYLCIYIYIHVYVLIYLYIHVYVLIYIYIYMYIDLSLSLNCGPHQLQWQTPAKIPCSNPCEKLLATC